MLFQVQLVILFSCVQAGSSSWASEATITETQVQATGLSNNTAYEWHVTADCGDYSVVCSFTAGDSGSGACGSGLVFGGTSLNVYPNPVDQILTVELPASEEAATHLTLVDMMGKVVNVQKIAKGHLYDYCRYATTSSWYLLCKSR